MAAAYALRTMATTLGRTAAALGRMATTLGKFTALEFGKILFSNLVTFFVKVFLLARTELVQRIQLRRPRTL